MFIEAGANTVSEAISFVGGMAGGLSGLFLPFVDGIRNSKSVSIFSKWAHGGKI